MTVLGASLSWAIVATCFAMTVAITKYDFVHRTRNALIAGAVGSVGAVIDGIVLGDPRRAVIFALLCFVIGTVGTFAGYALTQRR
jgi:hypothetical protein